MQFYLKINGVDFSPYIAGGGVTIDQVVRKSRRVTVLNGMDYRAEIKKVRIAAQLVTVPDSVWERLRAALETRTVEAEYTNAGGENVRKTFYAVNLREPVREVKGGNTYYRGITFTLEEK